MQDYQEKYIQNTREIAELSVFYRGSELGFDAWAAEQERAEQRIADLKAENIRLLSEGLFPVLDELHSASPETLEELSEFSDVLMDWKTNLDPGVYVVIHDAMLSYYRFRKDRNSIIRELYKLGMGLYYSRRFPEGAGGELIRRFSFRNEMVFTEAASYLRYFDEIEDTATRGYILRSLHNITLCTKEIRRRIAANARAMNVMLDKHYREIEPNLPWDRFVRASHQQMSINRNGLSEADLTKQELALVLDSCYEIFKPEEFSEDRNIRWLWPYYDMEYNCGYVDLETTMARMERLIESTPIDQYDQSGLYANVQLAIVYGQYMRRNPQLQTDEDKVRFLDRAYRRMMRVLLTCPAEYFDDYFFYMVDVVLSNFFEVQGSLSYRELAEKIMRRFSGSLYIRSRRGGDIMRLICGVLLEDDPGFFDDIPFIREIGDAERKREAVAAYAGDCGLFADFGLLKLNIQRIMHTRQLFEDELEIYMLHAVSGYNDFRIRKTTEIYADVALGHHSWYNGGGGYPASYIRTDSPYRQMTDVAAVVSAILSQYTGDAAGTIRSILNSPYGQFSPVVLSCLSDSGLQEAIGVILGGSGKEYYREIYDELVT